MKALVITCSNRAAAGVYEDTTGPMIVQALREWGFDVDEPLVVRHAANGDARLLRGERRTECECQHHDQRSAYHSAPSMT